MKNVIKLPVVLVFIVIGMMCKAEDKKSLRFEAYRLELKHNNKQAKIIEPLFLKQIDLVDEFKDKETSFKRKAEIKNELKKLSISITKNFNQKQINIKHTHKYQHKTRTKYKSQKFMGGDNEKY